MEINSLTLQALINQLNESQIVNEKDLKELVDDHGKAHQAIIMLGGFSQAQVPRSN